MKKSGIFMKIVIAALILQVILYTWAHLCLSCVAGVEIAPTATIGFYSFCGFEVGVCGWLKKHKKIEKNFKECTENEKDY